VTGPATFRLWIAFGTEAHAATLEASDTPWVDVTDYVRSATFSTSTRSSRFDRYSAGLADFALDNSTRLFDPAYAAGTYYGDFKRHVPIRVTAEHSSTRYTVWRGWVRDWTPQYVARADSVTTVRAYDALGLLSRYELDKVAATAANQTPAQRFNAVIAQVGLTNTAVTDAGQTGTLEKTTYGVNALQHLAGVVAADGGHLYADRDGTLTLNARVAPSIVSEQSTSQATLDDTSEPAYDGLKVAGVGEGYRDIVRISGSTGNVQEVDNSVTDSAPVVFQRLGTPFTDDSAALNTARFYADLFATESPYPSEVGVTIATTSDDLRTVLLPLKLRHRITVVYSPPGGGADISEECFIDGIKHKVTPGRWDAKYRLSPCDPFDNLAGFTSWLIVADATRGKVGTGTVSY
jgi:hypothetical protein